MGIKIISKNRRAYHDYQISDTYEAGLALLGTEIKSLRLGKVNLGDGWVDIDQDEAFLRSVHIGSYSHGNRFNHEERRTRRLLLHKKEIIKLSRALHEQGFTLVPTKIYFKNRWVKVEIGLGKGKKLHDKRDTAKKKDAQREIAKAIKSNR